MMMGAMCAFTFQSDAFVRDAVRTLSVYVVDLYANLCVFLLFVSAYGLLAFRTFGE